MKWLVCVFVFFVMLVAGACSEVATSTMTPTHTFIVPVTSDPDPLNGTHWKLVAFTSDEKTPNIPKEFQFSVEFRNGELSFRGGCNSIGGHYVLENGTITMTFAQRTEVDCFHMGPNVNETELAFSNAMATFDSYTIEENEQLRIRYADGELLFLRVRD